MSDVEFDVESLSGRPSRNLCTNRDSRLPPPNASHEILRGAVTRTVQFEGALERTTVSQLYRTSYHIVPGRMFRQWRHLFNGGASRYLAVCSLNPSRYARQNLQRSLGNLVRRRNLSHDSDPSSPEAPEQPPETQKQLPAITKYDTPDLSSIAHWTPPNERYKDLLYGDDWRKSWTASKMRKKLIVWIESGPPPFSTYRLTFGKHKGKLLDEIPDSYMVKYLIPTKGHGGDCPIVGMAVDDFLERHPNVKSQAGRAKTKPLEEGIMKPHTPKKKRG